MGPPPRLLKTRRPSPILIVRFCHYCRNSSSGVNYPWTLSVSVLLGAILLMTPLIVGSDPPLYLSDHVAGCLVILVAVTAMAEVVRPVRFLNVALGA